MNTKIDKKIRGWLTACVLVGCFLYFGTPSVFGASLNLAWNANTESDLAGYRIYYGTSPGNYTSSKETGTVTSYTLSNLNEGSTYYIVMTAFDTSLNESQKSVEISGVALGAEKCTDGIDNDGDGTIDCGDADCNNQTCNDNNLCTSNDRCANLQCQGTAVSCDDANVCTTDSCNPASGCVHVNNTASCNDNNACTTADTCSGGVCLGGSAPNCDDGNLCTTDSCSAASGCVHVNNTASCNDNNACTTSSSCMNGTCQGSDFLNCDDGDSCTGDSCNPQTGCEHTVTPGCRCDQDEDCTDSNLCTGIERCIDGNCASGTPLGCDDANGCTDDSCDPQTGCVHEHNTAACDDGLFCNGDDTCGDGGCTVHSGDPCQQLTCNEETNICEEVGVVCDNPDACSSYSGTWSIAARGDAYGGDARVSSKSASHTWSPELPQKGFYDVSMWWSSLAQGCQKCPVELICNGGSVGSLSVNQQIKGGQWNLLGTYGLEAGSACSVVLKSEGLNKKTCADAVKLVFRGENLPEAQIRRIAPNPADTGEEVYFEGYGTSPTGRSIISYSWVSDRDGEIGSTDLLYLSNLSEGTHQISFSVQDEDGIWSIPAHTTVYIGNIEITCDNGEACTSSTGAWKTLKKIDAFNNTSRVLDKNGTYTWGPYLPVAGYYEVYLWWSSLLSSCSTCPVVLTCGGEVVDTFALNQQVGGGQWNLLGSYELQQGTACTVTITALGSSSTIADAVRFVLVENLPNAHILFSH